MVSTGKACRKACVGKSCNALLVCVFDVCVHACVRACVCVCVANGSHRKALLIGELRGS